MRLNFSGVDEGAIREGMRRLGEVVREQVALYGTITGAFPAVQVAPQERPQPRREEPAPAPELPDTAELAKILPLPAQRRAR
jgi:2-aminoadipate transaminase